jgi:hypothetical protein
LWPLIATIRLHCLRSVGLPDGGSKLPLSIKGQWLDVPHPEHPVRGARVPRRRIKRCRCGDGAPLTGLIDETTGMPSNHLNWLDGMYGKRMFRNWFHCFCKGGDVMTVTRKPLTWFKVNSQVRKVFSEQEFRQLGESLKARQLQPVLALQDGTLIAGERRYRAAQLVGWIHSE